LFSLSSNDLHNINLPTRMRYMKLTQVSIQNDSQKNFSEKEPGIKGKSLENTTCQRQKY